MKKEADNATAREKLIAGRKLNGMECIRHIWWKLKHEKNLFAQQQKEAQSIRCVWKFHFVPLVLLFRRFETIELKSFSKVCFCSLELWLEKWDNILCHKCVDHSTTATSTNCTAELQSAKKQHERHHQLKCKMCVCVRAVFGAMTETISVVKFCIEFCTCAASLFLVGRGAFCHRFTHKKNTIIMLLFVHRTHRCCCCLHVC